ncbi:MAG: phosphoribosylamine--glycine ligase [Acidimicrobiaceae bacterium]|nr:phosphoribosylamine--glycine ligase [Acidimicrobiaceae bacterium]|tara:strand:+ start:4961 stop:6187 length:1227 start_codon:yes stop_codon:yes gene_type:complete
MRICVVGSGGREHALAHVLRRHHDVVVTPGNPGIPYSVDTPPQEVAAELTVIGPEAPLVQGLADHLRADGRLVFGPGADGARLEGSKAWMKEVLVDAAVPTATHGVFTDEAKALEFLDTMGDLFVVKTDGLAAGKGVLVTTDRNEAVDAVRGYLSGNAFGDAGRRLVIEEGLTGPELSVLAVCDGYDAVALAPAQDFKRLGDNDVGPNTGGMGAYSPVPLATDDVIESLMDDAVRPTLAALRRRNIDYRGVLYCGLMFTPTGPKVLEYNVRFGDPETQVVLPRIVDDLGELLVSAAEGDLNGRTPTFDDGAAVTVVCAAEGYPTSPRIGDRIEGLDNSSSINGVTIFAAGVGERDGHLVTAGGRVLSVTGQGSDVAEARCRAYAAVGELAWPGMQVRTDVAESPTMTG